MQAYSTVFMLPFAQLNVQVKEEKVSSSADVTKPLTIETKFIGPTLSGPSSESTDTASEVGSFSSPGSSQNSPHLHGEDDAGNKELGERKRKRHHAAFTPKDLLDLLKNVESEITLCEANLKEEIDKRKKYKIDDCRRTHNYDGFITSYLTMLAEQGLLADLVTSDNVMVQQRKAGGTPARTKNNSPSSNASARSLTKASPAPSAARRRPRPKRRR